MVVRTRWGLACVVSVPAVAAVLKSHGDMPARNASKGKRIIPTCATRSRPGNVREDRGARTWQIMAPTTPARVLIIEDDLATRETFAFILTRGGLQPLKACNGREGLTLLAGLPDDQLPHCILLDLRMPVMDGLQFRRAQRAEPRLAGIPVIVCSGTVNDEDRVALQVERYIQKPVEALALLAAVKSYCG